MAIHCLNGDEKCSLVILIILAIWMYFCGIFKTSLPDLHHQLVISSSPIMRNASEHWQKVAMHAASTKYYLLYGYCRLGNPMRLYHQVIMDDFKRFIARDYPHWIMLNISLEIFLSNASNYTMQCSVY